MRLRKHVGSENAFWGLGKHKLLNSRKNILFDQAAGRPGRQACGRVDGALRVVRTSVHRASAGTPAGTRGHSNAAR